MTEPYVSRYRLAFPMLVASLVLLGIGGAMIVAVVVSVRRYPPTSTGQVWEYVAFAAGFGLGAAFFAWMGLAWPVAALTHREALRVDADGVTLGRAPFPPSRSVTVPFRDIAAIVLFHRTEGGARVPLMGLRLKPSGHRPPGVPTPGTVRHALYRFNTGPLNPYPVDVYRVVRNWRLDEARLRDTLDSYHAHVRVLRER